MQAAGFRVSGARLNGGGIEIDHPATQDAYYILYAGPSPDVLLSPAAVSEAVPPQGTFTDDGILSNGTRTTWYAVRQVPLSDPLDSDGDLIDDAFELAVSVLDPLDAADAALDPDADGVDSRTEYLQGRSPDAGAVSDTNHVVGLDLFTPLDPG